MKIKTYLDPCLRFQCDGKMSWFKWFLYGWVAELLMIYTAKKHGGVGLAANQVGWKLPVVVARQVGSPKWWVLWEPKITDRSDWTIESNEGCLSIPDFAAKVRRWGNITVQYKRFRWFGKTELVTYRVTNPDNAVILQHEIDHLSGIMYIDLLAVMRKKEFQLWWMKTHA